MDVERTIEFILEQQARHEAKHERQMAAIRKIMVTGMKWLAKHERMIGELAQAQKETDRLLRETAREQKETGRQLKQFIASMRQTTNGRR